MREEERFVAGDGATQARAVLIETDVARRQAVALVEPVVRVQAFVKNDTFNKNTDGFFSPVRPRQAVIAEVAPPCASAAGASTTSEAKTTAPATILITPLKDIRITKRAANLRACHARVNDWIEAASRADRQTV